MPYFSSVLRRFVRKHMEISVVRERGRESERENVILVLYVWQIAINTLFIFGILLNTVSFYYDFGVSFVFASVVANVCLQRRTVIENEIETHTFLSLTLCLFNFPLSLNSYYAYEICLHLKKYNILCSCFCLCVCLSLECSLFVLCFFL